MKIAADFLREHDACEDQVLIFEAEWPDGAELTLGNLLGAAELKLDIWWLALKVLPGPARECFCFGIRPAYAKYHAATRGPLEAYRRDIGIITKAYVAYREAIAPHRAVLDKAVAHALIEALEEKTWPTSG